MSFNPYPSTADLSREADATMRDLADICALRELRGIVADAIARASRVGAILHPDRRWNTCDLVDGLQAELVNIDGEVTRIMCGPLVLEDA